MKTPTLVVFGILTMASLVYSQIEIKGTIRDINTHREINGVNIFIDNSNVGTTTGRGGEYSMRIPQRFADQQVVFQHISYDIKRIAVDSLQQSSDVYLVPRVIPLQGVEVIGEGEKHNIDIARDLPQSIALLDAKQFDIRGYVDAGDFLKTEHSVQVEEEMSGKKTLSIRGGNPDDVVVLYNGIKMNSPYDNVFDFSLVDLSNLERFEVVKGSNTALYGPEAFSGLINIVPQIERDYTARAQYRMGTYNTEDVDLSVYKNFKNFYASYGYKDGEQLRRFADAIDDSENLNNAQTHQNVNLLYDFDPATGTASNTLNGMADWTKQSYTNNRDGETLDITNNLAALSYDGDLAGIRKINVTLSYKEYDEKQALLYSTRELQRDIADQTMQFKLDKEFPSETVDFLTSYQFENTQLDFEDNRYQNNNQLFFQTADVERNHHGFAGIVKLKNNAGSGFFNTFNIDVSFRHDRMNDVVTDQAVDTRSKVPAALLDDRDWSANSLKFSSSIDGYKENMIFRGYINFGTNSKFPTLVQQLSTPMVLDNDPSVNATLEPEKVRNYELGFELDRQIQLNRILDGWSVSGNYFKNLYENKFRRFSTPGIPIQFFDNVENADISGVETKATVYFLKKKISTEFGLSKYAISEKSAFPFKSDFKRTLNVTLDHAGFSIALHWFLESEQAGWIRGSDGSFAEVTLEEFSNMDVHASKTYELYGIKFFVNFSARNILESQDVVLQGLAIRDRRAYLTFGTQF